LANAYDSVGVSEVAVNYYQKALDLGYKDRDFVTKRMNELYKKTNNAI